MLQFMCLILIFLTFLLNNVNSKCVAREYKNGGGKKGEPNSKIDPKIIGDNTKICEKITDPINCGDPAKNGKKCLWVEKDASELEGLYIKSVTYIGKKLAKYKSEKEMIEEWDAKGISKYDGKTKISLAPKILTIDSSNIMYEIEITDQDDFNAKYGTEWITLSVAKSKHGSKLTQNSQIQTQKEGEPDTMHHTKVEVVTPKKTQKEKEGFSENHTKPGSIKPLPHHRIKSGTAIKTHRRRRRRRLINIDTLNGGSLIRRRRLINLQDIPVNRRNNAPYNAFGLIIIQDISHGAKGTDITKKQFGYSRGAGGTIIWESQPVGEYKYIYVLVAGHDVIDRSGLQTASLDQFQFWPKWGGTDVARENRLKLPLKQTRDNQVIGLNRVWIHRGYSEQQPLGFPEFDIGLMKFAVHKSFVANKVDLAVTDFPSTKDANNREREMVVYTMGSSWTGNNRKQQHQSIKPYAPGGGNALQYEDVPIRKGFCGGMIVNGNNRVIAMQVSWTQRVDLKARPLNGCDDYPSDYSNCRGHGTKIQSAHISAFKWMIGIQQGRVPEHDNNNWRGGPFHALVAYDNMYQSDYDNNVDNDVYDNGYTDNYDDFDNEHINYYKHGGYSRQYQQQQIISPVINLSFIIFGLLMFCLFISCSYICTIFGAMSGYVLSQKVNTENQQKYQQVDIAVSE